MCNYDTPQISESDLLDELNRLGDGDNPPSARQMNAVGAYSETVYQTRFGSWNAALRAAGFEPAHVVNIPTDALLADLRRVGDIMGAPPTRVEYHEHGQYDPSTISRRIGRWPDALRAAGFDVRAYYERNPRGAPRLTDTALTFDLQAGAAVLGQSPGRREYEAWGTHSLSTYTRRFGSWEAALEAAGLPPAGEPVDLALEEIQAPETLTEPRLDGGGGVEPLPEADLETDTDPRGGEADA